MINLNRSAAFVAMELGISDRIEPPDLTSLKYLASIFYRRIY